MEIVKNIALCNFSLLLFFCKCNDWTGELYRFFSDPFENNQDSIGAKFLPGAYAILSETKSKN